MGVPPQALKIRNGEFQLFLYCLVTPTFWPVIETFNRRQLKLPVGKIVDAEHCWIIGVTIQPVPVYRAVFGMEGRLGVEV
jgi:hypothetical protein